MVAYDIDEFYSFDHALGQEKGVAVLSTMFQVGGDDNAGMMQLVDAVQKVRHPGQYYFQSILVIFVKLGCIQNEIYISRLLMFIY